MLLINAGADIRGSISALVSNDTNERYPYMCLDAYKNKTFDYKSSNIINRENWSKSSEHCNSFLKYKQDFKIKN
jgi:hypothetical protein